MLEGALRLLLRWLGRELPPLLALVVCVVVTRCFLALQLRRQRWRVVLRRLGSGLGPGPRPLDAQRGTAAR